MNLLITICARGGSKGIPGKNIKMLNGKPLLHYTLNHARVMANKHGADIQLSTDSQEILDTASDFGYQTDYIRPKALATDSRGKIDVIRAAWQWAEENNHKQYDHVLDMDVTSPLRTQNDLEKAYDQIKVNSGALNLFSVNPAARNPYFNMVELEADGFARVSKASKVIKSRQEAPKVYDMNASFYIFSRAYMLGDYEVSTTDRSLIYVMDHVCFDLDEPIDFKVLDIMLKNNLLDFKI